MPDAPIPKSDPAESASAPTDSTVLDETRPRSVAELGRELGDEVEAVDAVGNLQAAGLLYCTSDGFLFASRGEASYREIEQ